ncbi:hypothetical protein AMTR_s00043p00142270, partial [Amborella trichopoda]
MINGNAVTLNYGLPISVFVSTELSILSYIGNALGPLQFLSGFKNGEGCRFGEGSTRIGIGPQFCRARQLVHVKYFYYKGSTKTK